MGHYNEMAYTKKLTSLTHVSFPFLCTSAVDVRVQAGPSIQAKPFTANS